MPGLTEPLASRPAAVAAPIVCWAAAVALPTFGVGGVAVAALTPYVGTYEWLKLTCEWFGDSGVTGVTGVVWLICEICVNGVWLWLECGWWVWFKCKWLPLWYWTAGCVIVLIGACSDRFRFIGFCRTHMVFSFCHTNTLCTIAQPQNTMPMPIRMLVIMAGVEWNWVNVYNMMPAAGENEKKQVVKLRWFYGFFYEPVKNIGMEMKNPPTAQTLLTLDFCRYLFPLEEIRKIKKTILLSCYRNTIVKFVRKLILPYTCVNNKKCHTLCIENTKVL